MDYRQLHGHLPDDPLPFIEHWLDWSQAESGLRNPAAMALATANEAGSPSVRMVLLKALDRAGFGVFYTHYGSAKSRDLDANARAAGVLYWDALGRQLRLEGPVVKSPAAESDAYFASRPALSQINAIVSDQSQPIESADELRQRSGALIEREGLSGNEAELASQAAELARPEHWGGYRLWFDTVELWAEGRGRFHDRVRFERQLELTEGTPTTCGPWRATRLQP